MVPWTEWQKKRRKETKRPGTPPYKTQWNILAKQHEQRNKQNSASKKMSISFLLNSEKEGAYQ